MNPTSPTPQNNLTPSLTLSQLQENITALQKGGKQNSEVQSYVNNYKNNGDGTYSLNTPAQTTTQPATATQALPPTTAYGKATDVLQDFGNAAGSTNNALTGNSGIPILDALNPIGWVTKAIGGAANMLSSGLNATVNPYIDNVIAPAVGTALRNTIGGKNVDSIANGIKNAVNSPVGQSIEKTLTAPDVTSDLNSVKNIAGTAGIVAGAGQGAQAMQDVIPGIKADISSVSNMIPSSVKNAIVGTPATTEGTVGQIVQGTGNEISSAQRALTSIDTTGVKTFSDLSDKLQAQIEANTSNVDAELGKSTQLFTPADVKTNVPVSGMVEKIGTDGNPVLDEDGDTVMEPAKPLTTDPVASGLKQLQTLYDKTGDTENLARINGMINDYQNGKGLTLQQINGIARESSAELNAYGANGEVSTSLPKQAIENTRQALKDFVRTNNTGSDTGGDTTQITDKNTSDLIKTKDMVDDMDSKVQQLENKLQNYGTLQKFGRFAGQAFDMFTGGIVKGFLKSVMGIGQGQGTVMNAIQLQNALSGNLSLLNQLNAMPDAQAVAALSKIVSSVPLAPQESVLPAVGVNSQNQKTQKSHRKTLKGTK
jgi:hypothetical protein